MMQPKEFIHADSGLVVRVEGDPVSGGFFATVSALPGCGSQGDSVLETMDNLNEALVAVLDVLKEDQPKRYEAIIGTITSRSTAGSEPSSTSPSVQIE